MADEEQENREATAPIERAEDAVETAAESVETAAESTAEAANEAASDTSKAALENLSGVLHGIESGLGEIRATLGELVKGGAHVATEAVAAPAEAAATVVGTEGPTAAQDAPRRKRRTVGKHGHRYA